MTKWLAMISGPVQGSGWILGERIDVGWAENNPKFQDHWGERVGADTPPHHHHHHHPPHPPLK